MLFAGQDAAHLPQPTHMPALISAQQPCMITAAWRGQTVSQVPQATHVFRLTLAWRLDGISLLLRHHGNSSMRQTWRTLRPLSSTATSSTAPISAGGRQERTSPGAEAPR